MENTSARISLQKWVYWVLPLALYMSGPLAFLNVIVPKVTKLMLALNVSMGVFWLILLFPILQAVFRVWNECAVSRGGIQDVESCLRGKLIALFVLKQNGLFPVWFHVVYYVGFVSLFLASIAHFVVVVFS